MKNTHTRLLNHPIEAVRPWIERAWSGTPEDVFPRDYIRSWRTNPEGTPAAALVPGTTRVGHGPFKFLLTKWDGFTWRVELSNGAGWHGFRLEAVGDKTLLTHELEASLGPWFRVAVIPMHDWVVEAMFDRLEIALVEGAVPSESVRPMTFKTRMLFRAMRARRSNRARREGHFEAMTTADLP